MPTRCSPSMLVGHDRDPALQVAALDQEVHRLALLGGGHRLADLLGGRDGLAVDLLDDVADLEPALGRAAGLDGLHLDRGLHVVVELGEGHRDRGVLGGDHLDRAAQVVLLRRLVGAVDDVVGHHGVLVVGPGGHQLQQVDLGGSRRGDGDGGHPQLPPVVVALGAVDLDDLTTLLLAQHVDGQAGAVDHVRQRHEGRQQEQRSHQWSRDHGGDQALTHGAIVSSAPRSPGGSAPRGRPLRTPDGRGRRADGSRDAPRCRCSGRTAVARRRTRGRRCGGRAPHRSAAPRRRGRPRRGPRVRPSRPTPSPRP